MHRTELTPSVQSRAHLIIPLHSRLSRISKDFQRKTPTPSSPEFPNEKKTPGPGYVAPTGDPRHLALKRIPQDLRLGSVDGLRGEEVLGFSNPVYSSSNKKEKTNSKLKDHWKFLDTQRHPQKLGQQARLTLNTPRFMYNVMKQPRELIN